MGTGEYNMASHAFMRPCCALCYLMLCLLFRAVLMFAFVFVVDKEAARRLRVRGRRLNGRCASGRPDKVICFIIIVVAGGHKVPGGAQFDIRGRNVFRTCLCARVIACVLFCIHNLV